MEIRLVPWAAPHLAALEPVLDDPDVLRWTLIPNPPPPGFAERWLSRYEAGRGDGTRDGFAIEDDHGSFLGLALVPRIEDDRGSFLGLALVPRIEREAKTAELGYLVVPEARGRGVATTALRLLTEWAFSEADLFRLEMHIGAENEPSRRVAANCGYTREGLLRSRYVKQGRREDTEIWSRLATDDPPDG